MNEVVVVVVLVWYLLLLFLFFLWSLRKDQMMVSFCVEVLMLVLVKVEWLVWLVELV